MDEQTQAKFIEWLAQQLGVQSEDELQQQINDMGDEGIRQAFDAFQKETQTPMNKQGGKLEYLIKLQQGGGIYSPIKNEYVTDADVSAMRKAGMDFGTKEAYAGWLDTWGNKPTAAPSASTIAPAQPKMIRRYNQAMRSWETVPASTVMAEQNVQTVGQPGAWGKWDTSTFKKQITPQDTIGQSPAVRKNVQQGWDMQKINPAPTQVSQGLAKRNAEGGKLERIRQLAQTETFKKGGSIKDKGQDGKTALLGNNPKGEDKSDALGGRKESGDPKLTALKKLKRKGQDGKTALLGNNPKGKDGKSALNGRKDGGMNEHTALNRH